MTKVELPVKAPDARNTVIAVEYDSAIVTDPNAKGKYHWYTNRAKRHTDIRNRKGVGEHKLHNAVKEARQ